MAVRDALLLQKRELELRRQEPYIECTAKINDGNNRLIRIVIGPRRPENRFSSPGISWQKDRLPV